MPHRVPAKKILWSWLGAFVGIYSVAFINESMRLSGIEGVFLIGSFGASAVLVYGTPKADFAQPRNLVGGHVLSALIGVFVGQWFGESVVVSSALAVSLSVVAMHATRTVHPPGGATALIAVAGGEGIRGLGYAFSLFPVGLAAVLLLVVGLVVNNLSRNPKRHYPVYWL